MLKVISEEYFNTILLSAIASLLGIGLKVAIGYMKEKREQSKRQEGKLDDLNHEFQQLDKTFAAQNEMFLQEFGHMKDRLESIESNSRMAERSHAEISAQISVLKGIQSQQGTDIDSIKGILTLKTKIDDNDKGN